MIRAVGVVVPAHDEEDLLPLCLASLREAAQTLRGTEVHLVVVADACRDLTAQATRRGGASVVTVEARNVGTARAAGVREVLHRTRHLDPADVWLATTIRLAVTVLDGTRSAMTRDAGASLRAAQRVPPRHGLRPAKAGAGRLGWGGPRRRPTVTR